MSDATASTRRIDGFFYGLFMDAMLLRDAGVAAVNPRRASVADYALRIGQQATLVPSPGARVFGMLFSLTHEEMRSLYEAEGLRDYRPEAVLARTGADEPVAALCYNLVQPPGEDEHNPGYAAELRRLTQRLGFPPAYIRSIN